MEGDLAFFIHFNIVTVDRFVESLLRSLLSKLAQHRPACQNTAVVSIAK